MNFMSRLTLFTATLIGLALCAGAARPSPVQVEKAPPQVERKTFDPAKPPPEMPPLTGGEAAVTQASFKVETEVSVEVAGERQTPSGARSAVKVQSVGLKTSLAITIWLPEKATDALKEHEEAHRQISQIFYEKAETIARRLAERHIGRVYWGDGADAESARKAAMDEIVSKIGSEYMKATQAASVRVNELFDDVTDHGRKPISAEVGIKRALERYAQQLRDARE